MNEGMRAAEPRVHSFSHMRLLPGTTRILLVRSLIWMSAQKGKPPD